MIASSIAQDVAIGAGVVVSVAAAVGAIGALAKSPYIGRPIRWLWRRNVSEPGGRFLRSHMESVVDDRIEHLMHNNNGGSSLLDLSEAVERVEKGVRALNDRLDESAADRKAIHVELDALTLRVERDVVEITEPEGGTPSA